MKTLGEIIKQSPGEKYKYPDVFSENCGLDIVFPEKKLHAVKQWGRRENNRLRRVTLRITTFRGMSFNAIHYYGQIVIQGVDIEYIECPGRTTMVFDDNIPLAHYSYNLELKRPVTQAEIVKHPDRWEYYHVGDLTNCFETIEDVIALARDVFRLRFSGDWEFYVDSPCKIYNGKIAI